MNGDKSENISDGAVCRFVQIADVHYVSSSLGRLPWDEMVTRLPAPYAEPGQRRVTSLIETMLPVALEQIYNEIRPDFVVYTGDQVNVGWDAEGQANYEGFLNILNDAPSGDIPTYFGFGNHDHPRSRFEEFLGASTYSFECSGCHFAMLDSGLMGPEEGEDDPDMPERGLEELERMLDAAAGAPAAVFLHFYMYPSDIPGYSFQRAHEARKLLAAYPRVVPVINGHHHPGRVDVAQGMPYITARSFIEGPYCFYVHELSEVGLRTVEYVMDAASRCWTAYDMLRFDAATTN